MLSKVFNNIYGDLHLAYVKISVMLKMQFWQLKGEFGSCEPAGAWPQALKRIARYTS